MMAFNLSDLSMRDVNSSFVKDMEISVLEQISLNSALQISSAFPTSFIKQEMPHSETYAVIRIINRDLNHFISIFSSNRSSPDDSAYNDS